jgi:hypothetical protein
MVICHPGPIFHSTAAARRAHVSRKIIHTLSTMRVIMGHWGRVHVSLLWIVYYYSTTVKSSITDTAYLLVNSLWYPNISFGIQFPLPPLSRPLFPVLGKKPTTFPLWKSVTVLTDRHQITGTLVCTGCTYTGRHNFYSKELFDWRKNKPKCILDLSTQSSGRVRQFFVCLLACYMVFNRLISSMDWHQLCAAHVHSAAPALQRIARQLRVAPDH